MHGSQIRIHTDMSTDLNLGILVSVYLYPQIHAWIRGSVKQFILPKNSDLFGFLMVFKEYLDTHAS
jgi:hypothetical protein